MQRMTPAGTLPLQKSRSSGLVSRKLGTQLSLGNSFAFMLGMIWAERQIIIENCNGRMSLGEGAAMPFG